MVLYLIPALGTDNQLFSKLRFTNYKQRVLPCLEIVKNEPLAGYVKRLISHIDQSKPVVLIGCSLGGILAIEIAKQISIKKVILISSIKTHKEMDWRFKILRVTNLHMLFPYKFVKGLQTPMLDYMMGLEKNNHDLFYRMVKNTDWRFSKWAVNQVIHWENESTVDAFHIHGREDRIFLSSRVSNATIISGGHFIIVQRATQIEELILIELKKLE